MIGQCILLLVTLLVAAAGATPAGAVLSVGNLAGSFFNGAGTFVRSFMAVKASKPLWEKFRMDTVCPDTAKSYIDEIPEITLHNVSFQYGDKVILQGINYSFHAGCKYAVMGESGSGKTTLTKIILGLLPGYTGDIRYGKVEQKHIFLENLHRHIAYVDQQVYLFQDGWHVQGDGINGERTGRYSQAKPLYKHGNCLYYHGNRRGVFVIV